jgi:hydroxypyruvate reductase
MHSNTLTQMREDAKSLFAAGVHAVDAYARTKQSARIDRGKLIVRDIFGHEAISDLSRFKRILLIGFGKVAASMAQATEELLQDRITDGVIIASRGNHPTLTRSKLMKADHPLPDENGLRGAQRLAALVSSAGEQDLILCLISGGGSALCPLPQGDITVEDLRALTRQLLGCGASIEEINTVRKHLSQIKGGQLARLAYPATVISLIISDVIGDRIDSIASGPFAPDRTTFTHAYEVMEKYALTKSIPASVRDHIEAGLRGTAPETMKPDDPVFHNTCNLIIANNLLALRAIEHKAQQIGYSTLMLTSRLRGDTREAARIFGLMIRTLCEKIQDKANICLIAGGEMTVRLTGKGRGGRNCDFGLALAPLIKGMEKTVVLSAGTDGIDGSTDAAGAVIDGTTLSRFQDRGLDHHAALINQDSYSILKRSGDLLMTGPTNTNVMDIQLVLVKH